MIRINIDESRKKSILEIYKPSGAIVQYVKKKIITEYKNGSFLIRALLEDWFYKDGEISTEMISAYFLDQNTRERINAFAQKVCEIEWQNAELCDAFIHYHSIAKKPKDAAESAPRLAKLDMLADNIDERHIQAQMFVLANRTEGNCSYQVLEMKDIQSTSTDESEKQITIKQEKRENIESALAACKRIFNYTWFHSKYGHGFLNAIGVKVCPYCNRQYITSFRAGSEERNTGDIEHFYDKSTYPFLALSPYNFVPSCQICNSRFKGTKDFYLIPHVNPHISGFGSSARFRIDNIDAFMDEKVNPIVKLAYSPDNQEIKNSIETFHLDELYQNHQDYAKEIVYKARIFSDSQIEEYLREYGQLFSSKSELYQIIYGNYLEKEDQGKRPLSKLTQDLLIELHVIPE